jgi:HlyD family secretion protein
MPAIKSKKFQTLTFFLKLLIYITILWTCFSCSKHQTIIQGYIEGKYTYITGNISGTLDQLFVDRGTPVKTGQILFILDQEPETSALKAAEQKLVQSTQTLQDMEKGSRANVIKALEAQKVQAIANLDFTKKTLDRYHEMIKYGAIDKSAVDRIDSEYLNNKKKVEQMSANLEEAKLGARENAILAQKALVESNTAEVKKATWALEQKTKRSPIDAMVFDTLFKVGETVNSGQPVVSLLAAKNIKLIFFIPEKQLSRIALGNKINFTCDSCNKLSTAVIDFISPEAEYTPPVIYSESSRDKLVYRVEAKLPPESAFAFHPGQPVQVILQSKST